MIKIVNAINNVLFYSSMFRIWYGSTNYNSPNVCFDGLLETISRSIIFHVQQNMATFNWIWMRLRSTEYGVFLRPRIVNVGSSHLETIPQSIIYGYTVPRSDSFSVSFVEFDSWLGLIPNQCIQNLVPVLWLPTSWNIILCRLWFMTAKTECILVHAFCRIADRLLPGRDQYSGSWFVLTQNLGLSWNFQKIIFWLMACSTLNQVWSFKL